MAMFHCTVTALLLLGISYAVISQRDQEEALTGARVSLRILKRNQLKRSMVEDMEDQDRFHRVTRNNDLLGRYNRINKRKNTAVQRLVENQQPSLRQMNSEDHIVDY